ncbi:MAG: hypothetical protein ACM30I_05180 [Gemmatimonas sp.]
MNETIEIRLFDPKAGEAILNQAHGIHFPSPDSAAKRRSYVSWLTSNPVPGSIYLAAYVDGSFASFLGFMAREVVGQGRTLRAALAFGAMTLPEFQGRGLYRRLAVAGWDMAARGGFDIALGYTNRPYVLSLELRMGWRAIVRCPVMALPLDLSAVVAKAAPFLRHVAPLAAIGNPAVRAIVRRVAGRVSAADCVVEKVADFSSDFDGFAGALTNGANFTFIKDWKTLSWLYLSPYNPFTYDILEARRNGALVGFAVGRPMDLRGLSGYGILDLICLPGHEDVLAPLAARLVADAVRAKPQIIAALVSPGDASQRALARVGFINSGQSFTLIGRSLVDDLPAALRESAPWQNSWGNNDTV